MKKGKSIKLKLFNQIKTTYGTVNHKDLKSVYINIQSWVTPKNPNSNWKRIVGNLTRSVKHSVYNYVIKNNIFKTNTIVDLDLRTSGINFGKKSFLNLEITLFLNLDINFKDPELKKHIESIIESVYYENIKSNKYFDFSTKKDFGVKVI